MRYLAEYRDAEAARTLSAEIARIVTRPWTLMEVCGGQTHAIVKYGIDTMLPPDLTLAHGPGCPVCVTPLERMDQALAIAARPRVLFCTFGDMLRVPGSTSDLYRIKASGGDVRVVYSPLDAVELARRNPEREVVFFAVGFETTAPAAACAVEQAAAEGLKNFSLLVSHVLVPPAIEAILSAPGCRVQGFLAAGHVCTIMGLEGYPELAQRYRVPIVVTGFEPIDLLQGILCCVRQLEEGRAEVENPYARAVRPGGNPHAQASIRRVFRISTRSWRGMGEIESSGLELAPAFSHFDALKRFDLPPLSTCEPEGCISGLILQGQRKPKDCPLFGTRCRPEHPVGATMVSSEGACAAYFRYRNAAPAEG